MHLRGGYEACTVYFNGIAIINGNLSRSPCIACVPSVQLKFQSGWWNFKYFVLVFRLHVRVSTV